MKGWKLKAGLLVALATALTVIGWALPLEEYLRRFAHWASGTGTAGLVAFALFYMIAAVLFLPGSPLTLGAGAVFGLWRGTLVVSAGATLGAGAAFLIARYLGRERIALWAQENAGFAALDQAVGKEGGTIVFLVRLSPLFPYSLVNYLFGLTRVGFFPYLLASWLGMLPGTILYVYLGFAWRALVGTTTGPGVGSLWEVIFWGVGLAATLLLTVYLTRMARRALSEKTS